MQDRRLINGNHRLHGLGHRLTEDDAITREYTHTVQSARSASLHWGSTMIKCFKGNEGARQDCYVFTAFTDDDPSKTELCIMRVQGICKVCGPGHDGVLVERKLAYGKMATCAILQADHRCNEYSDGPDPGVQAPYDGELSAHKLPSMLQPVVGRAWYDYVVELRDIQAATALARVKDKDVFLPYVPMSSHA